MIIIQNEGNDDSDDYACVSKIICDYLRTLLQRINDENEYDYVSV